MCYSVMTLPSLLCISRIFLTLIENRRSIEYRVHSESIEVFLFWNSGYISDVSYGDPTRSNLRQEGFIMVHKLRENSPS